MDTDNSKQVTWGQLSGNQRRIIATFTDEWEDIQAGLIHTHEDRNDLYELEHNLKLVDVHCFPFEARLLPAGRQVLAQGQPEAKPTGAKTRDEIEALKANWLGDPCWDIEDTEGFEAHRNELAEFHNEQNIKNAIRAEERLIREGESLGLEDNRKLLLHILRLESRINDLEALIERLNYHD